MENLIGSTGALVLAYVLAVFVSWPVNAYQTFFSCDWEDIGKCEAKVVGVVVPPVSPLTVFLERDK